MKIGEFFNFEDIQKVIEIESIEDEQDLVEKFIISPNLQTDLLGILEYLNDKKPERNTSIDVIGNYGTGKSHLLGFLSIILSNPEMVQYIQDDLIREEFSKVNREFLVVKHELPGLDKSLSDIFFYRVREQLKENYGVEIREIDADSDDKDPKELIEEILVQIKDKYPNKGLIVIFDEYSDFLNSKESYKQNMDLQFTRQLAECSITQDFILMLSMQENVFSNPKYKDKSDLFSKIEKRFTKINITSENVSDIVSKRILRKTPNQIQELKNQFELIKETFPNIAIEEEKYINLFPANPHLIEIFSKLPFFENRSILTFIANEAKNLMDEDFPKFITYDLIYDNLIDSDPIMKNKEDVKPVVDIVTSLRSVVPRLNNQYQERAHVLINALAIKNLISTPDTNGEKKGGDTPENFAETLFMFSNSKIISPADDVESILNQLIKNSDGQFISKNEENNTYFINLNKNVDYEQLINGAALNMDDIGHNNAVFVENFLLNELGFEVTSEIVYADNNKKYVIDDSLKWNERNSYREGVLTINIGNKLKFNKNTDYLMTIKCFGPHSIQESALNHIIIKPKYGDDFKRSIRRLAAVEKFLKIKTRPEVMHNKKNAIIDMEIKPSFKNAILKSTIIYKNQEYSVEELGITTDIVAEIFSQIKSRLLGEDLVNEYPQYPKFESDKVISKNNIEGTINNVIKELSNKERLMDIDLKSKLILLPLELYKDNAVDVNNSKYASIILNKVENNFKNILISDIVKEFESKPFGIQKEITYLLIAVLFRNGNIMISHKNGKSYTSSDFSELFNDGLKVFNELKYIRKEEGPNAKTQELFDILELDRTLLENKKNYSHALKSYIIKYDEIISDINFIRREFNNIDQSNLIHIPMDNIKEKINIIDNAHFEKMDVKTINDFNNLDYSDDNLNGLKEAYELIHTLKLFIQDYNNFIYSGIRYMDKSLEVISSDFFNEIDKQNLYNIYDECIEIINNPRKLLKKDQRIPLEGKIDLFKEKYKNIYFTAHEEFVGNNVNWDLLEKIKNSSNFNRLNLLSKIESINNSKFTELKLEILKLEDFKCVSFNIGELDTNYCCSLCMFPQAGRIPININNKIEEIDQNISLLVSSWESQIVETIYESRFKLDQLDENQQEIIHEILNSKSLPENIDYNVINAINNLFKDIEIKEILFEDLYDVLTGHKDTLKVDELINNLKNYTNENISDVENTRIKIIKYNGD